MSAPAVAHPLSRATSTATLARHPTTTKPARATRAAPAPPTPPKATTAAPPPVPPKTEAAPQQAEKKKHKDHDFKEPPRVVYDRVSGATFQLTACLGQGGFARVYQAKDQAGKSHAIKVINRSKLADTKAKTRLYAEIKIHRALSHPHVCSFLDCFEDTENVYITLELCRGGSMMDFVRRRGRLTEPEARFYMVQLAGAINYLHQHNIIHRDLKLGNLFLDDRLDLKVGDFGLAALIEKEGERKTTICGTPNYIAPEVLFASKTAGHSYEVDIWSMGVILYTMLVGKPPFQTSKVEDIYKRIRDSNYEFPPSVDISQSARNLISTLLSQKPEDRPSPSDLLSDPFITGGYVPLYLSSVCLNTAPSFTGQERLNAADNLRALRERAQIDVIGTIRTRQEGVLAPSTNGSSAASALAAWEDGERDFKKAVGPGSPLSALLKSAKQPLMVTRPPSAENLIRKVSMQSLKRPKDDLGTSPTRSTTTSVRGKTTSRPPLAAMLASVQEEESARTPRPRSVAASRQASTDTENVPPAAAPLPRARSTHARAAGLTRVASLRRDANPAPPSPKLSQVERALLTLNDAFDAKAGGRFYRSTDLDAQLAPPAVFVHSWMDYSHKYGMGYALTDGTTGVYLNDSTSVILSPDLVHFDYVQLQRQLNFTRSSHDMSTYPQAASKPSVEEAPSLDDKVNILRMFHDYIYSELYRPLPYTFVDNERTKNLDFVLRWYRAPNVAAFLLSNDCIQFNFSDHTKMVVSHGGLFVSFIDKEYTLYHSTLADIIRMAVKASRKSATEVKLNEKLIKRLRYCRDVLTTMQKKESGKEETGFAKSNPPTGTATTAPTTTAAGLRR